MPKIKKYYVLRARYVFKDGKKMPQTTWGYDYKWFLPAIYLAFKWIINRFIFHTDDTIIFTKRKSFTPGYMWVVGGSIINPKTGERHKFEFLKKED